MFACVLTLTALLPSVHAFSAVCYSCVSASLADHGVSAHPITVSNTYSQFLDASDLTHPLSVTDKCCGQNSDYSGVATTTCEYACVSANFVYVDGEGGESAETE